MTLKPTDERLSNITTNWDLVLAAHERKKFDHAAASLRGDVLHRYANCIRQYILGAVKDIHTADDLSQEFSLRFVRGDFSNANPDRGRFRDYLKVSLRNLITDHARSNRTESNQRLLFAIPVESDYLHELDETFQSQWRERVLSLTWASLKEFESHKNNQYHSVLRLRAKHPEASSDRLAAIFESEFGKQVNPAWIRQNLKRSRRKFSELLIEEICKTVQSTEREEIDQELERLGLQKYVDRSTQFEN